VVYIIKLQLLRVISTMSALSEPAEASTPKAERLGDRGIASCRVRGASSGSRAAVGCVGITQAETSIRI
jgi:hypothetical protein